MASVLPCNLGIFNCSFDHDGRQTSSPHARLCCHTSHPVPDSDSRARLIHQLIPVTVPSLIRKVSHPFVEPRRIAPTGP